MYAQIGDRNGEAAMCLELAGAAWEANESAETFAIAQAGVDLLIASDVTPCELARAYAMITRLYVRSSHAQDIAVWGERALAAGQQCGDGQIVSGILMSLGVGRHLAADIEAGMALLERGLDLAQRSGSWLDVGRADVNRCDCCFDRGDYAQMLTLCEAHQRHVKQTGWEDTVPAMLFEAGRAHVELGHLDDGFEELVAMSEATMPTVLPLALALHRRWLTRMGRAQEAGDPLERACAIAEHDGVFEKISTASTALIHTKLALGRLEEAVTVAERALAYWRSLDPVVGSERLLLAVNRVPGVYEAMEALDIITQRAGTPLARAARLEAAEAWRALAIPYQEARARNRVRGRRARAHPVMQDALECPLTRREREVLAAIARGESSGHIAATLVLSEHTILRHVANMLTKLQVSTRAAAVALASRHGWI
jgi:DNA-binding CsgD family transcriptional regulator